ncbi:hypothetical protein FOXG_17330 [Fusarium oxysporum f. sp. lycopersici 4287]|uniref:Uncharacterized protein n=2 Tax=Fusarium oxysporum TaxID=5507 RepID=A0A0J9WCG0_FUSO4|nr:hypothetical protein FOXG_17330 [Fusarium oxysporum f. sp. lycopersici 4287]KNB20261.1 hypothetical protein FOXG_17330 [Fusarium oxysporum f. sp. lycopersici 4287]
MSTQPRDQENRHSQEKAFDHFTWWKARYNLGFRNCGHKLSGAWRGRKLGNRGFNTTVRLIIFDPIYESENTLRDEPIVPREKANPLDMAIGMVYGLMNIKKRLRI